MLEPKRSDLMDDAEVRAKHDAIDESQTLDYLLRRYAIA
jgi:hypothetical protein